MGETSQEEEAAPSEGQDESHSPREASTPNASVHDEQQEALNATRDIQSPVIAQPSFWEFDKRSMCRTGMNSIKFIETGETVKVRYHHSSAQLFEIVGHEEQKPSPAHGIMKADRAFEVLFRFLNNFNLVERHEKPARHGLLGRSLGPSDEAELPFIEGFLKFLEEDWGQPGQKTATSASLNLKWIEATEVLTFSTNPDSQRPLAIVNQINSGLDLDIPATFSELGFTGNVPKIDNALLTDEKEKRALFLGILSALGPLDLMSSLKNFPEELSEFLLAGSKCMISPLLKSFNLWGRAKLKVREAFLQKKESISAQKLLKSSLLCPLLFPQAEMDKVKENAERLNVPSRDILFPKVATTSIVRKPWLRGNSQRNIAVPSTSKAVSIGEGFKKFQERFQEKRKFFRPEKRPSDRDSEPNAKRRKGDQKWSNNAKYQRDSRNHR